MPEQRGGHGQKHEQGYSHDIVLAMPGQIPESVEHEAISEEEAEQGHGNGRHRCRAPTHEAHDHNDCSHGDVTIEHSSRYRRGQNETTHEGDSSGGRKREALPVSTNDEVENRVTSRRCGLHASSISGRRAGGEASLRGLDARRQIRTPS